MEDNEIFNRIFDKLDSYGLRIGETCNSLTRIDQRLCDFIEAVNKKEAETKHNMEKRYKNMTIMFGSITTVSILVGLTKTFGLI